MRPGNLRRKYNLPEKGAFIRMIWFYTCDMSVKSVKFFRYMLFPSRGMEAYRSMVEEVETRDHDQQ